MTEILTRPPLDSLSMSAAQTRTRRTSARPADPDEDGPPSKKQKMERVARAPPKQVNGKKAGPASKQADRVYEQSVDDFTFTKKPKKAAAKQPTPVAEEADNNLTSNQSRAKSRSRKSKSTEVATNADEPRRRSKRLSGEKSAGEASEQQAQPRNEEQIGAETTSNAPDNQRGRPRQLHRTPNNEGRLHVDKKRRATKIALPFADTPVIQRNREMRQTSSENRRRSSSTMRGRRASSLIDSGTSNAVPHDSVETAEFYKHISQDLPEPRRMKHLLTWCGARSLTERPSGNNADVNATLAARVIQDELLKDFANRSEMSDWFSRREEVAPVVLVKKPNPRNIQNAAKLRELEQEVTRLEREKATWDSLLGSLSSSMTAANTSLTKSREGKNPAAMVEESQLGDADQIECLRVVTSHQRTPTSARRRLQAVTDLLEFKIDSFAGGVHKLEQLEGVVKGTVDRVMQEASSALEKRDVEATGKGNDATSVGDLLRAFSRAAS